jgi:hypothetical protein
MVEPALRVAPTLGVDTARSPDEVVAELIAIANGS